MRNRLILFIDPNPGFIKPSLVELTWSVDLWIQKVSKHQRTWLIFFQDFVIPLWVLISDFFYSITRVETSKNSFWTLPFSLVSIILKIGFNSRQTTKDSKIDRILWKSEETVTRVKNPWFVKKWKEIESFQYAW